MARNLNISIDAGSTFSVSLPAVRNAQGTIVDLTGATVIATMKKGYFTTTGIPITCIVASPTNGIITLSLSAISTSSLDPGRYVYDVLVTDTSAITTREFEGIVEVKPGVSSLSPTQRSIPKSRQAMKNWCLRKLGFPVLEINVDDDQVEDLIDSAFQMFREYHYDASQRTYLKHLITTQDITNMYFPCDESIISIVKAIRTNTSSINLFDLRYQIRLQDFSALAGGSMINYEITQEKLALMDWMLNPEPAVGFTRHQNRIYVNLDWKSDAIPGDYIIFEAYVAIDPEVFTNVYDDKWLKAYTTALIKQQWGANLSKFSGTQLVGGVSLNGPAIYDQAQKELSDLEHELKTCYQPPTRIFLG